MCNVLYGFGNADAVRYCTVRGCQTLGLVERVFAVQQWEGGGG